MPSGIVRILKGKGKKYRTVIVGAKTRRALLKYRRTVPHQDNDPLIQTNNGKRLSPLGLRSALLRISQRSGIKITPHALRRSFATLSIKAGMNIVHLQGLLGHSSIETTRQYIQMLDDDLLQAHQDHGPIDRFL